MAGNERLFSYREDALRYGTYMGLFWIVKFCFLPMGFSIPLLQLLYIVCTFFVPVLGYLFVRKYRDTYNEGDFGFAKAFGFTLWMYVAAILLEAIAHYVYFRYIDHGYLVSCYLQQMQGVKEHCKNVEPQLMDSLIQAFDRLAALTPLQMVYQFMSQNILYSILLSLFTALFTMKRMRRN